MFKCSKKTRRHINISCSTLVLTLHFSIFGINQAWSNGKAQPSSGQYERIISLAPHITEMLYSAGAGDKIVGVVSHSDYPIEAQKLPIIGSYNTVNLEEIIQLNPDLILAWQSGNHLQDIERLKGLGFNVQVSEIEVLDDIPTEIERLGYLSGTQNKASKQAKQLRKTLANIRLHYQNLKPISSFYEIWHRPLITMNGRQFISQALNICGANNVFFDLKPLTAEVGLESLLARNPQVFFLGGQAAFQKGWLDYWNTFPSLQAIKNQQIYLLNNNHYQRPTARLINALESLCQKVDKARQFYQK